VPPFSSILSYLSRSDGRASLPLRTTVIADRYIYETPIT